MKKIPLYRLFPNVITLVALCLGITSIKYSFAGDFQLAVIMILVAAIMDGLDGSAARL
jgi:CDP-diacylglycerol--serine O-phosphatidyltransferase